MSTVVLQIEGYCPICEKDTIFTARDPWYRASLSCPTCEGGSVPRERAVALILNEQFPNWRDLFIHECSPANRGISSKMKLEAKNITQTHFYPGLERGSRARAYRNEDLQRLTFTDNAFDLFISLDVMEHIPDPEAAFKEIHRTLKPGGYMLCTWPVRRDQVEAVERRVSFSEDGTPTHIKEPEYHGNPISGDGALVTVDYGYEIHKKLTHWAAFDVRVLRFADRTHGILGDYTEVFLARKRAR
jgi:SAM-dependent methyltransferase